MPRPQNLLLLTWYVIMGTSNKYAPIEYLLGVVLDTMSLCHNNIHNLEDTVCVSCKPTWLHSEKISPGLYISTTSRRIRFVLCQHPKPLEFTQTHKPILHKAFDRASAERQTMLPSDESPHCVTLPG